ncbi:hypothetical protein IKQ21_05880, partial [bacterium]|nr:hypothetical protein [bacterium]
MNKKKIIVAVSVLAILCGGFLVYNFHNKTDEENVTNKSKISADKKIPNKEIKSQKNKATKSENNKNNLKEQSEEEGTGNEKTSNMYNSAPSGFVPFSAMAELPNLPANIQTDVKKVIDGYGGILMLKHTKDKVVIIAENPENIRHGIDFIEINVHNGHQTITTLGYNGKIKDSENDIWEYNNNQLPTKHTKFNKDGDVEYVETWNYESDNPIKYEMKNAEGKTLSMRKETLKDGTDMRIEHLIYDTSGNTKINVSTTYDGADIKRFTYYNADKLSDGESVFSEYNDGVKTKETVYSSDLKVKNVYEAKYEDGERVEISVFD